MLLCICQSSGGDHERGQNPLHVSGGGSFGADSFMRLKKQNGGMRLKCVCLHPWV